MHCNNQLCIYITVFWDVLLHSHAALYWFSIIIIVTIVIMSNMNCHVQQICIMQDHWDQRVAGYHSSSDI